MKAVSIKEPGRPEVLEYVEADDPSPSAGEVVIDVAASALNRADVMQRMGLYPVPPGASPYPGLEVSGRISALGSGVTGWQIGDEVCALLTGGGYAQKVAVPAGQLLTVPRGVGLVEAAALPEAVATVWSNIVMTARLKQGETFLVHGGTGGVGAVAIQIAKALGARVVATAGGPEKAARARELGADRTIDYRTRDFTEDGPYGVILDVVGGQYLERKVRSLAVDGRLVVIGLQDGLEGQLNLAELVFKRASVHGTTLRTRTEAQKAEIVAEVQEQVWPMIEKATVQLVVDRTLPMAEAGEAHRLMEAAGTSARSTGERLKTRGKRGAFDPLAPRSTPRECSARLVFQGVTLMPRELTPCQPRAVGRESVHFKPAWKRCRSSKSTSVHSVSQRAEGTTWVPRSNSEACLST